jgi:PKD repeat protein
VWPEERLTGKVAPTTVFKVKGLAARTFKFTDESTEGTGAIVTREWSFGDGAFASGNSLVEEHTYALAGEYTVTLITIDRNGLRSHAAHTVVIF